MTLGGSHFEINHWWIQATERSRERYDSHDLKTINDLLIFRWSSWIWMLSHSESLWIKTWYYRLILYVFMYREFSKMEEAKMSKSCIPEQMCCPGDPRQVIDHLGIMQPLTIKTEQAKRSCNSCLTNSPKKVN